MASKMLAGSGLLAAVIAGSIGTTAAADTVILNYVVTNNSLVTTTFLITANEIANISGPTLMTGSVQGTVTDLNGDGAFVGVPASGFMYTALIDGVSAGAGMQLMNAPFAAGQFLSGTGGPEFSGIVVGPQVNATIGIMLEFTLSPGDSASFTSIFTVIPGPGVLAGMAGLVALGRRRRA
jgi:hypothetical protein